MGSLALPTAGEEFVVQVNGTTGRVALAWGPTNVTNLGGGKFGIDTGLLLPDWLDERRADCDVMPYEDRQTEDR
jgi:hypothetical protein